MKLKKLKKRKEISDALTVELEAYEMADLNNEDVLHGYSSIIGSRKSQQDAVYVDRNMKDNYSIAVICDGMGGLASGAEASITAVNYIAGELHRINSIETPEPEMESIVERADKLISEMTDETGNHIKSGTTVAAVLIKGNRLHWVSVGDSKIYILKNGALQCVTEQHNYRYLSEQKRYDSTFRFDPNVRQDALVSYIGAGNLPYIDLSPPNMILDDGDMIMLCSDGLYNALSEHQIKAVMMSEQNTIGEMADALTESVVMRKNKNQDNTTVVVLKYKKEE